MKKMVLTAMAVTCLTGAMYAQDNIPKEDPPQVTVDPTQETFNEMWMKWIEFNNWDKDAAYSTIQNIEQTIREEFPMDPEVEKQVAALNTEMYAKLDAKAKEMGFPSFKDAYASSDPRVQELKQIECDYDTQRYNLTNDYYQEFQHRYQQACIDAITRLMENAESIK